MTNQSGEHSPAESFEKDKIGVMHQAVVSVSPKVSVHAEEADVAPLGEEGSVAQRGAAASAAGPAEADEDHGYHDVDGAVHFEGREIKVGPGIPVPSKDMVRRHRKSGHCPYRPWCAHCVSGAANAPAHKARIPVPSDGTP